MTIADFKQSVLDYMNRDATPFNVSSVDQVLQAMNHARRAAQRAYAFELLRADVFLTTSNQGASWATGCTVSPGGATVAMRRIDSIYNYVTTGGYYSRVSRIDLGNVNDYKRETYVFQGQLDVAQSLRNQNTRPFAYINGTQLFVNASTTPTSFLLNGITWLPDLTGSEQPDIFLTYFTDWFLWATIQQLNQYIKDSQRVNIDTALMQNLWQAVKEFDGQNANAGDNATLD